MATNDNLFVVRVSFKNSDFLIKILHDLDFFFTHNRHLCHGKVRKKIPIWSKCKETYIF